MLSSIYARKNREDGFTLIELLIVVIIIGILAAIALPIFIDQQKVAVDASVQSDVRNTVTNITSAQGSSAGTTKLAKSRDETSVKVFENGSTDADPTTDNTISTPALGTTYKVEGKNAKGLKYTDKAFQFDSTTGKFTTADATVPVGVVISSTTFDDGTQQGFSIGSTPATVAVEAVAGHPFALHVQRRDFAGYQESMYGTLDFSKKLSAGKTYKLSADVYIAPGTTITSGTMQWDLFGTTTTDLKTLHSGWQTLTSTVKFTSDNYIYPALYTYSGTNTNNDGQALDIALDNVIYTQMD